MLAALVVAVFCSPAPRRPRTLGALPWPGGLQLAAEFKPDHTRSPPHTVAGTVTLTQNPLTGNTAGRAESL